MVEEDSLVLVAEEAFQVVVEKDSGEAETRDSKVNHHMAATPSQTPVVE